MFAVLFWHFHKTPRVYFDVVVQVADDADFKKNVRTLFNNDHDNTSGLGAGKDMNYVETAEGKLVDAKGVERPLRAALQQGQQRQRAQPLRRGRGLRPRRRSRREAMAGEDEKGPGTARRQAAESEPRRKELDRRDVLLGPVDRPRPGPVRLRLEQAARVRAEAEGGRERRQAAAAAKNVSEINVALLGAGAQGQVLLDAMLRIPGLRFRAVCDIWKEYNQKRVVNTLKKYKFEVNGYEDYREMLDKEKDLDAVVIATPDFWHAPHTVDCLKAGKHVYCEKEMSNTLEGARSMVLAARETGKLLQIGHQRRSHPRYLHCYDKLLGEAKLLGRIVTVNGQWNRAVSPDLGWPERYAIPADRLKQYGFKSMEQFRNWRWYKGLGRRPDRRPRLAPDRHLQLVPGRRALARHGERRPRLPRPEDPRVVRHRDGRSTSTRRRRDRPAPTTRPRPRTAARATSRTSWATRARSSSPSPRRTTPASSTATPTPPPGTSGSRRATSRRRSSRSEGGGRGGGARRARVRVARPAPGPGRPARPLPPAAPAELLRRRPGRRRQLNCPAEVGYETAVTVLKVNEAIEAKQRLSFRPEEFKVS